MALAMILVAGNKGAFPGLVSLSPFLIPSSRIEIDEDQWLRKFVVNYLLTLWFNEGQESVIWSDRRFSLAHKLVRWAIFCRPLLGLVRQGPAQPVVWGPPTRLARWARRHIPSSHWKNPVCKHPFYKQYSKYAAKNQSTVSVKETKILPCLASIPPTIFYICVIVVGVREWNSSIKYHDLGLEGVGACPAPQHTCQLHEMPPLCVGVALASSVLYWLRTSLVTSSVFGLVIVWFFLGWCSSERVTITVIIYVSVYLYLFPLFV